MNLYGYEFLRDSDLIHYGVKGMKWGIINEEDGEHVQNVLHNVFDQLDYAVSSPANKIDLDSLFSDRQSFSNALMAYGKVDVTRFSEDQLDILRNKYKTRHENNRLLSKAMKSFDKYFEKNPDADPKEIAKDDQIFRSNLEEIGGVNVNNISDSEISRLRQNFLKHYADWTPGSSADEASNSTGHSTNSASNKNDNTETKEESKQEQKKSSSSSKEKSEPWDLALARKMKTDPGLKRRVQSALASKAKS